MYETAYDFKSFYNAREGRVIRRIIQTHILQIWDSVSGLNVLGCGYALPYLRMFKESGANVSAMLPASKGAHNWPHDGDNLVFLSDARDLPIETNSVDRVIMIHDLESSENIDLKLQEIWRILKSNGRFLVIVPNRAGFWARRDWSPFGHGSPYSLGQINHHLRENLFVLEQSKEALFMPPLRYSFILKAASVFEKIGRYMPLGAGLHMVEASKQLYARATPGSGSKVRAGGIAMPKPVVSGYKRS